MNFSDILALAKQGYKPADIKELLAIEIHEPDDSQPEIKDAANSQALPDAAQDEPINADAPAESAAGDIDYKKLYETEKLKNELLQKENINRNYGQENVKTEEEELHDIIRGFM